MCDMLLKNGKLVCERSMWRGLGCMRQSYIQAHSVHIWSLPQSSPHNQRDLHHLQKHSPQKLKNKNKCKTIIKQQLMSLAVLCNTN